jgi:hypothetical protein
LHPLIEYEALSNEVIDEDYSLDIFKMTIETNEPIKELVNWEL